MGREYWVSALIVLLGFAPVAIIAAAMMLQY
jgi:hypothetical protein